MFLESHTAVSGLCQVSTAELASGTPDAHRCVQKHQPFPCTRTGSASPRCLQAVPSALLRFAEELLLGRAVSRQRCPLAMSSLHPRSPAQLSSTGPAQGSTFSACPRQHFLCLLLAPPRPQIPRGVPGPPGLTAPERQQGLSRGTEFQAD